MKCDNETDELNRVLDSLESMFEQYCQMETKTPDGRLMFDHMFMSSGEDAQEILLDHDRITMDQCKYF